MREITSALIERTAARLGDGGWRYTMRQLYYAACAEAETRQSRAAATGELGLGLILVLVALILIRFPIPFTALLALGLLLIVTGATQRLTRRAPLSGRVLALSYPEFQERAGEVTLPAMLETGSLLQSASIPPRLVLCDTDESALIVNANRALVHLETTVLALPFASVASANLPEAQSVVALHDASPRGCALALELADMGVGVVDAGLRPKWLDSPDHQVIEGAPARLPRDLAPLLSEEEVTWLAGGQRLELATLTPGQVMGLVAAAIDVAGPEAGVAELELSRQEITRFVAPHPRG